MIPAWFIEGAAKLVAPIVVRVVELLEERSRVTPPPAPTREGILAQFHDVLEERQRAKEAAALREERALYDVAEAERSRELHDGGL